MLYYLESWNQSPKCIRALSLTPSLRAPEKSSRTSSIYLRKRAGYLRKYAPEMPVHLAVPDIDLLNIYCVPLCQAWVEEIRRPLSKNPRRTTRGRLFKSSDLGQKGLIQET